MPYVIDSGKDVEDLSEAHDLCIGGDCIEMLQQTSDVCKVIPYVKVVNLFHIYVLDWFNWFLRSLIKQTQIIRFLQG